MGRSCAWCIAFALSLGGCGKSTETGVLQQGDDAGPHDVMDSGSALSDGAVEDHACESDLVKHVIRSHSAQQYAEAAPAPSRPPNGGLPPLPADPCATRKPPSCPEPHDVFACPIVTNANGSAQLLPGDTVVVTVPFTPTGNDYACSGVSAEDIDQSRWSGLLDGVRGLVETRGPLPASVGPGSVIHFVAGAAGPTGDACLNDLNRLGFDVVIGSP